MTFRAHNITFRGQGDHPECQDASAIICHEQYASCIVADGHSSAFRSRIGSKLAVESAVEVLEDYLSDVDRFRVLLGPDFSNFNMILETIEKRIYGAWLDKVLLYDSENPLDSSQELIYPMDSPEDIVKIYGSTLLIGVLTDDFWFAIQVGDGTLTLIDEEGQYLKIDTVDERCMDNRTTSLSNYPVPFHHDFGSIFDWQYKPVAIFANSDGFCSANSDVTSKIALQIFAKSGSSLLWYRESCPDIERMTYMGTKDDTSVSFVFNPLIADFFYLYRVAFNDDYIFDEDPDQNPMDRVSIAQDSYYDGSDLKEFSWYYASDSLINLALLNGDVVSTETTPIPILDPMLRYKTLFSSRCRLLSNHVPEHLLSLLVKDAVADRSVKISDLDSILSVINAELFHYSKILYDQSTEDHNPFNSLNNSEVDLISDFNIEDIKKEVDQCRNVQLIGTEAGADRLKWHSPSLNTNDVIFKGMEFQVVYDGQFLSGLREGQGSLFVNGQQVYSGGFKNGLFSGEGCLRDGVTEYEGLFDRGIIKCEQGKIYKIEGDSRILVYSGGIVDKKRSGPATLPISEGHIDCFFVNDMFSSSEVCIKYYQDVVVFIGKMTPKEDGRYYYKEGKEYNADGSSVLHCGKYSLIKMPSGSYSTVFSDGFSYSVDSSNNRFKVLLMEKGEIKCIFVSKKPVVLDDDGFPCPGQHVDLYDPHNNFISSGHFSNDDGKRLYGMTSFQEEGTQGATDSDR